MDNEIIFKGTLSDEDLLTIATQDGWTATVVDPADVTNTIPNPMTYQKYAVRKVIGRNFVNVTEHLITLPQSEDLSPKAFRKLKKDTYDLLATNSTIKLNGTAI